MDGKTVVITGGNQGIGFATADELAKRGAKIVLMCRNVSKMEQAKKQLLQNTPTAHIITIEVDLMCFESVRRAVECLRKRIKSIHVLILNAGMFTNGKDFELVEGIHSLQVVNHFSHFLLVNLAIDMLEFDQGHIPRVIAVSSGGHKKARGDFRYWQKYKTKEDAIDLINDPPFLAYGESKLANILHMQQLAKMQSEIRCFSLHPGPCRTSMLKDNFVKWLGLLGWILRLLLFSIFPRLLKSPEQAAQMSIFCTLSPELDEPEMSGKYFVDLKEAQIKMTPQGERTLEKIAEELWEISEEVTNSTLPCKPSLLHKKKKPHEEKTTARRRTKSTRG